MESGYIQIYTGQGKGKTTAALGLGLRAVGHGLKVLMIQFLKSAHTSELDSLKAFGDAFEIRRLTVHKEFFWKLSEAEKETVKEQLQQEWHQIEEALIGGHWDLIILDEIFGALYNGMVSDDQLERVLEIKPKQIELVLTGRYAPMKFIEKADLVTEMKKIKHYYDQGVPSRKGIEF